MGGDTGPSLTVPALASSLSRYPSMTALVFGDETRVSYHLKKLDPALQQRVRVIHSEQIVDNSDRPSAALRHKRNSSMWAAIAAVKDGDADACVSAGNTGALMAMGKLQLSMLPGIDRPAICSAIPTLHGKSYLMDMGASLDCNAEQLHQYALLGTVLVRELEGIERPSVRLLNVGVEAIKGGEVLHQAATLLEQDRFINYQGFVEGDGIFQSAADIIICDGFVGNVALKTGEGLAKMVAQMIRETVKFNFVTRMAALLMYKPLRALSNRLNPSLYNGASLLGVNGILVKSHGGASVNGFSRAIDVAYREALQNLPQRLAPILQDYQKQQQQFQNQQPLQDAQ